MLIRILSAGALLLLTACASRVPPEIRLAPEVDLGIRTVQQEPRAHVGEPVRWGGVVAGVENREKETWLEISARPLDSFGRPVESDTSPGRFLVRTPGFLDPTVYREGRLVTVRGEIESIVTRRIGEHPYHYPLVRARRLYLWPELPPPYAWPHDPWDRYGYWGIPYHYRYPYPAYGYPYHHRYPYW